MIRPCSFSGATGELTPRYVLSTPAGLREVGKPPEGFGISGLADREQDRAVVGSFAVERFNRNAAGVSAEAHRGPA